MSVKDLLKSQPDAPTPRAASPAALTTDDVESFKRLGAEVKFESPFGTFWLVPARTTEERFEYTPEDILNLSNIAEMFDARVVALRRNDEPAKRDSAQEVSAANSGTNENEDAQRLEDARRNLNEIKRRRQKHEGATPWAKCDS